MAYEDAKHRPHAIHTGEEPRNPITVGPESLRVTLDRWGPTKNLFTSMYDALQANWGESPSRTVDRYCEIKKSLHAGRIFGEGLTDAKLHMASWEHQTGWCRLLPPERDYVEACFAGKTLQQVLEGITFDFCIDGVSRAFTHQNVRTRVGAGFMQHGGRDNDWRHRGWTMPETMRRMCEVEEFGHNSADPTGAELLDATGLKHCITDWNPIDEIGGWWDEESSNPTSIRKVIEEHINNGRRLYSALVDAGIPWQDARRVLFMGMQTYIHDQYNYLALNGMLANRLEHIMDWEHNCVAQLMLREIKMKCPPLFSKYLGSHSDKAKQARFDRLESWPPDGKWPGTTMRCKACGHNEGNHRRVPVVDTSTMLMTGEVICEVCERDRGDVAPMHVFVAVDTLPRQHRPEQNPFFVLHPDSMAGGPIEWIPTNGTYPHDRLK